ncbi:MAG: TIGR03086 family metal-binding protein [Actinophytocola sp.]|uniref:TIGR03086 family metal-binding protein n=1 Tax=Actinophytocola sp. TaxID=1872138 RepID=UPI003C73C953
MDLLDAHGQAVDVFDRAMHKVGLTDWDSPTPCSEWTVRDLVNHIVVEQLWVPEVLAGRTVAEVGDKFDGDRLDDDPPSAWQAASDVARSAWLQAGAVDRTVHLSYGDADAADYGWQMTTDLTVHGWDLATALGADPGIPDELARAVLSFIEPQAAALAGTGMFADPVPVPADAPAGTRLIGLLGRTP